MPENINQTDVQTTLAKKIENQEALKNAEELKDVALAEGNIQVLKSILTREEGEDEAEHAAEQAALKTAIEETAVAHEAEGVTPTLIRMWIYGEDIDNSLDALGELSVDSYSSILSSPEATQIVQKIARQLEIDIGDGGDNEDGVDGKYGALTTEAVGKIQEALIKAGLLPATMENGNSNQDGKFGKRTLAALRGAVKTEEAAEAVKAVADVTPAEGPVVAPAPVDGPAPGVDVTPKDPRIEAFGESLADDIKGIEYVDGQFVHLLGETEAGTNVYGPNGEADTADARTQLEAFNNRVLTSHGVEMGRFRGLEAYVMSGHPNQGLQIAELQELATPAERLTRFNEWKTNLESPVEGPAPAEVNETRVSELVTQRAAIFEARMPEFHRQLNQIAPIIPDSLPADVREALQTQWDSLVAADNILTSDNVAYVRQLQVISTAYNEGGLEALKNLGDEHYNNLMRMSPESEHTRATTELFILERAAAPITQDFKARLSFAKATNTLPPA